MMNAAVNNGQDDPPLQAGPPFDVAMRGMVQQYGALRVVLGALRQLMPMRRATGPLYLSAHLRRDIGLLPEDQPNHWR
jgi:hypothetical protein